MNWVLDGWGEIRPHEVAWLCWRPLIATIGGKAICMAMGEQTGLISDAITFAVLLEIWIRVGPYTGDPLW